MSYTIACDLKYIALRRVGINILLFIIIINFLFKREIYLIEVKIDGKCIFPQIHFCEFGNYIGIQFKEMISHYCRNDISMTVH